MLEINWNKIKLSFNSIEIELPQIITIKMCQKNDKQRNTKFSHNDKTRNNIVQLKNRNRISINLQILHFRYGMPTSTRVQFPTQILQTQTPSGSSRHRGENYINAGDEHF